MAPPAARVNWRGARGDRAAAGPAGLLGALQVRAPAPPSPEPRLDDRSLDLPLACMPGGEAPRPRNPPLPSHRPWPAPGARREANDFANTQTLTQLSIADIFVISFLSGLGEARGRPAEQRRPRPPRRGSRPRGTRLIPNHPRPGPQEWLFRGALLPAVGVNYTGAAVAAAVFGALHVTGAAPAPGLIPNSHWSVFVRPSVRGHALSRRTIAARSYH